MPPVIVAAALAYTGAITIFTALVVTTSYALGQYQQSRARKAARDAFNAAQKDRFLSVSVVDAPRSRIYGRVRNADGILFKGTYGDKKQYLQMVVALAAHEVDAIETVYFGDIALDLDGNGFVATKPWNKDGREATTATVTLDASGNGTYTVTGGSFWDGITRSLVGLSVYAYAYLVRSNGDGTYGTTVATSVSGNTVYLSGGAGLANQTVTLVFQGDASASKARVQKFTGSSGQDLSSYLATNFPALIQSGKHRFEGIACLLVTLEYDQDVYPQGVPQISAIVRGARITDRRTGVTAWSQNPSVIADDWARYVAGGGAADDELDALTFNAAANACDVSHLFSTKNQDGIVFNTTRPMYQCNIALDTTADASDSFAAIVESMAGQWAWSGGRLRVRAGAYTAPVTTITETWLSGAGDIEIVGTLPRSERVNVMTPTIFDSQANYTSSPQARIAAAAYIELDGQELPQEVTLEGVTDVDHAQHICGVMMRESRQALTVKLPCKFKAYPLEVFDVVSVTLPRFGWSGKAFEVVATEMTQSGGVVLTLKETDASVFDPDAQFTRQDPAPNTALPDPFTVPTPAMTSIASGTNHLLKQADGSIVTRMLVTWSPIQDEGVRNGGSVEVRAMRVGSTEVVTETVDGTQTQAYLTGLKDGNAYAVTIRARNKLVAGVASLMVSHVVQGKSQPPSNVAGLSAAVIPGAVHVTWTQCPDIDYDSTKLRYGASWAAGTELPFNRPGNSYDWPSPTPGTYTIWAAHVDTSGNLSAAPQSYTVVVTAAALYPANAALSIKLNVNDFAGTVNYSEAYIHGRDAAGNAIDAPGTILVNGVATAVPNGNLYTNQGPVAGYIVWDSAGSTFSQGPGLRPYVMARRRAGVWEYDDNGLAGSATGWTAFTPTATHWVIGTLESGGPDTGNPGSAPGLTAASIWAAASTLNALEAGADAAYTAAVAAIPRGTMNSDPGLLDAANSWTWDAAITVNDPSTATGALGVKYFSCAAYAGGDKFAVSKQTFPLSADRTYDLSALIYADPGNDRNVYLYVDMFKADGTRLHGSDTGWGGTFAGYTFGGQPATGQFTRYGADFGAGTSRPIPSSAACCAIGVWFQYTGSGSSSVHQAAEDIRLVDVTDARAAAAAAATAQSTANTAASNASSALGTLATMRSNGYLDASEKPEVVKKWQAIADERPGIYAQGTGYGLTTLRDAYQAAYSALGTYLGGLSPAWNDTSTDTPITPSTDLATWTAYYTSKQALLNAISDEAAKRAQWNQVGGSGKPLDNAGRTVDLGAATGVFGARNRDDVPGEYPHGRSQQFKEAAAVGLSSGDGAYCTLETIIQYTDDSGGPNVQYAYQGAKTWRRSALRSASSWGVWTQDLDRNAYTGDLNATLNDVVYSSSAPSSPTYRMTWIDTSVTPRTIKIWSGSAWLLAGTYVNGTAQIVDDANLGLTAIWSGVAGSGKPADNATRNQVFFQDGDPVSSPGGVVDGAIWISSTKAWQRVSGAWQPYVGTGSIGTGELGAGSATDVLWTSASDSDIFSASGSTVGTMLLSYLAPYDCDVVVSTTGNIDQICSVAQWSTYADITANTSLTVSETTVRARNVSSGDPFAKGTLAITKRFFQAAGTTVFYTLVGVSGGFPRTGPQAGCACWFRNQQMVLEAIKR